MQVDFMPSRIKTVFKTTHVPYHNVMETVEILMLNFLADNHDVPDKKLQL